MTSLQGIVREWLVEPLDYGRRWLNATAKPATALWRGIRYRYPHRMLLIAGMPKSGTEWMQTLLLGIPGYQRAQYRDPKGLLEQHFIDASIIRSVPRLTYSVLKTHIAATPEGLQAIRDGNIPTLVMWRDLRDQAVSRYFHVMSQPQHQHHALYQSMSKADGVSHSVDFTLDYYVSWLKGWKAALEQPGSGRFLLVRYEDLNGDPLATFQRVLDFWRISLPQETVRRMIEETDRYMRQGTDLAERLQVARTFRSGKTGDWRNHFSARDVEAFKARAGTLLVELGYERDLDWSL